LKISLQIKASFSEAHFRCHYTEVNPLSYPIPLPPTVLGMFGALLGWNREEIMEKAGNHQFGAKLLNLCGVTREFARIIQFKEGKPKFPFPIENFELLVKPSYILAIAGEEELIRDYYTRLKRGYLYLPYGGRNDFFLEDVETLGFQEVALTREVESYAPSNWVTSLSSQSEGWVRGLQVMHKIDSASKWFYFAYKTTLKLDRELLATADGVTLYPIKWFHYGKPIREHYGKSV